MNAGYSAEDAGSIRRMFARIAPRYDLANTALSGGLDHLWRRHVALRVAALAPDRVLDLASGSGALAAAMRRVAPRAEIVGADFCAPLLLRSRRRGFDRLVVADALALPFADGTFDVVTVGFGLRNMASYEGALREMHRVLRPGGRAFILDFSLPEGVLTKPYRWYLHHVLPTVAGALTGVRQAYDYLGESIERFPRGEGMADLLRRTGFYPARPRPLSGGVVSVYVGRRD